MWIISVFKKLIAIVSAVFLFVFGGGKLSEQYFTVNFFDYDGETIISSEKVLPDCYAIPPLSPKKSGATFLGWSGNYISVNKNENVKAVFNDEKNVFILTNTNGKIGENISATLKVDGKVNLCGFDLTIAYDDSLELVSVDDSLDLDIVVNTKAYKNSVILNFSAASNKTSKKNILKLNFIIKKSTKTILPINIKVNSNKEIYGNKVIDSNYTTINGFVKL